MKKLLAIAAVALMNLLWFANGVQAQVWYHHRVFDSTPMFSSYTSNAPAYTFSYTPGAGMYSTQPGVSSYLTAPGAVGTYYVPSTSVRYPYRYAGTYYPGYPVYDGLYPIRIGVGW